MKSSLEALDWDRFCQRLAAHAECALGRERVAHLAPFRERDGAVEAAQAVVEAMALCGTPARVASTISVVGDSNHSFRVNSAVNGLPAPRSAI